MPSRTDVDGLIDRGLPLGTSGWEDAVGESSLAVLRGTTCRPPSAAGASRRGRRRNRCAAPRDVGGPSAAWLWAAALVPSALAAVDWQLRRSAARRRETSASR
jgi:hypothetical protein